MEAMIRAFVFTASILWLAGCSSTWESREPVTSTVTHAPIDSVERSAGKLRRLVLLPPVVEPKGCPDPLKQRYLAAVDEIEAMAKHYLADSKDYEIIEPGEGISGDEVKKLSRELGEWQEASASDVTPPEELRAPFQKLARDLNADGVVVLHAAPECIDWIDVTLNLLAIGMPHFYGKLAGRNFSVGIYEAAGGSLVWQHYMHAMPGTMATENLLRPLENAVPKALVSPIKTSEK